MGENMNISFEVAKPKPRPEKVEGSEEIILNGRAIGRVDKREKETKFKFHAVIKIGTGHRAGLAQGFADSPERAVMGAFLDAREEASCFLIELDRLEKEIMG